VEEVKEGVVSGSSTASLVVVVKVVGESGSSMASCKVGEVKVGVESGSNMAS